MSKKRLRSSGEIGAVARPGYYRDPRLPDAIRALRSRLGWRQVDLAERLGVSARTVESWETGAGAPRSGKVAARLFRLLSSRQAGFVTTPLEATTACDQQAALTPEQQAVVDEYAPRHDRSDTELPF